MLPFVKQSHVSAELHIPMGGHHARECDGLHNPERVRVRVLCTSEQGWQIGVSLRVIILLSVSFMEIEDRLIADTKAYS